MKEEKDVDIAINEALLTKALGYEAEDEVLEYVVDENNRENLAKRKITKKKIPPDISAAKAILGFFGEKMNSEITNMTDEELENEKTKLEGEIDE